MKKLNLPTNYAKQQDICIIFYVRDNKMLMCIDITNKQTVLMKRENVSADDSTAATA